MNRLTIALKLVGLTVVVVALALGPTVSAAPNSTIVSNQAGDWNDPATWVGGVVPGPGDDVEIQHVVTLNVDASIGTLWIDTAGTLNMTTGDLTITKSSADSNSFLYNDGTFSAGGRTVTLDNSGDITTLYGSSSIAFADLVITTGTTVDDLSDLGASATSTFTNNGVYRRLQSVLGTGSFTFGLTGVTIYVSAQGDLTNITVERIDEDHPNGTGVSGGDGTKTGKYWTITPAPVSPTGFSANITLPHNGLSDPSVCRYSGVAWDCAQTSFNSPEVQRDSVTAFSDWTVGQHVGPTVVQLQSLSAGATSSTTSLGLLALTMLSVFVIGAAMKHRR